MASNFLEELVAEWYEYQEYFVRRNVLVGKRIQGGYESELDVVAFHPTKKHLVHIETSMDSDSWEKRAQRFARKFEAGRAYIPKLFSGFDLPPTIDQKAVFVFASRKNYETIGSGQVVIAGELLKDIFQGIRMKRLAESAIPENLTILRSFQFVAQYWGEISQAMRGE
jgi:hypothetical protein